MPENFVVASGRGGKEPDELVEHQGFEAGLFLVDVLADRWEPVQAQELLYQVCELDYQVPLAKHSSWH